VIDGVLLSTDKDKVTWDFEKTGIFSTASLYKELLFPGVNNRWLMGIWEAPLPLQIKIFLWQVCNDKIQSAEQRLRKRNWPGEIACKVRGQDETTDHIIFGCALAQFVWCVCRDLQGWDRAPANVSNRQENIIEGVQRDLPLLSFLPLWLCGLEFMAY
jgi:hypothetical protein